MFEYAASVLEVILINIVLSGDNAVVVALVARDLPAHQRRQALTLGGASAVLTQLGFTLAVSYLLLVPGLRLAGALILAVIACRLLREEAQAGAGPRSAGGLGTAVVRIALVNLVMSLDNAVAVAGVSRSDPVRIGVGLTASALIILAFSSVMVRVIGRFRWVAYAGAGVLALTAAGMMWQDAGAVVGSAHLPAATAAMRVLASQRARWAFEVVVVSTCLSSPQWWRRAPVLG